MAGVKCAPPGVILGSVVGIVMWGAVAVAEAPPVNPYKGRQEREEVFEFARKPKVEKQGDRYVITFASKGKCDATIAVLDTDGKIIRHLASGILGPRCPAPFVPGLAQSLVWDGLDDSGRPAPAGCRVRVSLGLGAQFERYVYAAPQGVASRGPVGIAMDSNGTLYVMETATAEGRAMNIVQLKAFDREGNYLRTVIPFRADRPEEKVSAVDFLDTPDGRRIPLSAPSGFRPFAGFLLGMSRMPRHIPVITKDGRFIYVCGRAFEDPGGNKARRLLSVYTDGRAPRDQFYGPVLPEGTLGSTFLALSPDEQYVYVTCAKVHDKGPAQVVYRVQWGQKNLLKPFIGVEFEPGADNGHFNDPRGLATDAAGRLYICDYGNDRIQVFSATGEHLKTLPVKGPEQVLVHPKTGALYVLSVRDHHKTATYAELRWEVYGNKSILKFGSIEDWREVARIDLPKRERHFHDCGPVLCLDASRSQPVIWAANVGRQEPGDFLWKIVDQGERLERVEHRVRRYDRWQIKIRPCLAVDCRTDELYVIGGGVETPVRIDGQTGKATPLTLEGEAGRKALDMVGAIALGPEGMLYLRSAKMLPKRERLWMIRRFDRQGRLVPFQEAGEFIETGGKKQTTPWNELPCSFAVDAKGKIYVIGRFSREVEKCHLDLYSAEGKLLRKGLVELTASPGCVRVDGAGRLYVADTIRPRASAFPSFYPNDPRKHLYRWYGTLFRFQSEGGSVLEAGQLGTEYLARYDRPAEVWGALWGFYGISPMPQQAGCQCVTADFDTDDWGRCWVPDVPGNCVAVLDAAGNVLMRFGSYGNWDARGAGSTVPDPPIPLWHPDRVAVSDSHAYVLDSYNRRVVQVNLVYAATAEVPVP